jgi:hypothetical protein
MRLPRFAAEVSLPVTNTSYRGIFNPPIGAVSPTIIAQLSPCDPCDICGDQGNSGGGGGGARPACPGGKCCGTVTADGRCGPGRGMPGVCRPTGQPCPVNP